MPGIHDALARHVPLSVVTCALALAACQTLPDVATNECGNGVIELGEDCEPTAQFADRCGAVASDNACFFVCAADVPCPDGYGCGVDGRCRQATGAFVQGVSQTMAADQLEAGDVDGDGYDDLIAASGTSIEVEFGSAQGDLTASVDTLVATPQRGIGVADLDADGAADLLIGTTPGIQTLLGSGDRVLDPFSYPIAAIQPTDTLAIGAAIDVDDANPANEVLLAWADQIGIPALSTTARRALPDPTGPVDGVAANLLAPLPVARLTASRASASPAAVQDPTVEVALGYGATSQIFLYQAAGNPLRVLDTGVVLDPGAPLVGASGLLFGYFDGDDCLDLVAHAGLAVGHLVLFRNTPSGATCTGVLRAGIELAPFDTALHLLAAADFDGDGVTDLVTSDGVFRVTGAGPWTLTRLASAGEPYVGAQIVDINGDGAPDVAAFRKDNPDVDVLINAGGVFNRFVVATQDAVQRLAAGDFDGDLTPDLAIVELDSAGDTPVAIVSVSFGQFHGPPSPRVVMDQFDVVTGLVSASVVGATGELDDVDDLIVLEDDPVDSTLEVIALYGSGARGMTSPLTLQGPPLQSPQAFAVGHFDGDVGLDLFAIGSSSTAFLFTGAGTGELTPVGTASWPGDLNVGDAVWSTGDVSGDGVDEIAAAERRTFAAGPVRVVLFAPDPAHLPTDPVIAQLDGYAGAHAVRIADLDGDGDADLLVGLDPAADDAGTLQVGWNEGGAIGTLVPVIGADGCIDAVPVSLDTDARPELVALCRDPAAVPGQRDNFVLRRIDAPEDETLSVSSAPLASTSGGRTSRLLTADLDGDGLGDIVVATRGAQAADLRVYYQLDVHATVRSSP